MAAASSNVNNKSGIEGGLAQQISLSTAAMAGSIISYHQHQPALGNVQYVIMASAKA